MPEMPIVQPCYDDVADEQIFWLPPEMVVGVTDSDGNVIAYGIKIDPDEMDVEDDEKGEEAPTPEVALAAPSVSPGSVEDVPLPAPGHRLYGEGRIGAGKVCLGCEWVALRGKIRAAQDGS
jgi:hypothetical protein